MTGFRLEISTALPVLFCIMCECEFHDQVSVILAKVIPAHNLRNRFINKIN